MKKTFACTACRAAKRRCNGADPCDHCVRRGETDLCIKTVARKRGRPRSVTSLSATVSSLPLDRRQCQLLSLLLSPEGARAVFARPADFIAGFAMECGPNFFLFSFPQPDADQLPVAELLEQEIDGEAPGFMFGNARVEKAVFDGQWPELVCPELYVGRTYGDLIDLDSLNPSKGIRADMLPEPSNFTPTGIPRVVSFMLPLEKCLFLVQGGRSMCRLRCTLCLDGEGYAKLMFSTLVSVARTEPALTNVVVDAKAVHEPATVYQGPIVPPSKAAKQQEFGTVKTEFTHMDETCMFGKFDHMDFGSEYPYPPLPDFDTVIKVEPLPVLEELGDFQFADCCERK